MLVETIAEIRRKDREEVTKQVWEDANNKLASILLKKNCTIHEIRDITGLKESEIKKLKKIENY